MRTQANLNVDEQRWKAVTNRDRAFDGKFFTAVLSTGIYCRPSCPARHTKRENVVFYASAEEAESEGFRACLRCHPKSNEDTKLTLVRDVCEYIEAHVDEPVTLSVLSEWTGVSEAHLQRTFKAVAGISPREYLAAYRLRAFKEQTRRGANVTEAQFEAGYGSSSRLYEASVRLGMTPGAYSKGAAGQEIACAFINTPVGLLLIAATERGLCSVQFGESQEELERTLHREFPRASMSHDDAFLHPYISVLTAYFEEHRELPELPLDIKGTAFQERVWSVLRRIPVGETRSYSDIAKVIGEPKAVRAVAGACGANPIAVVTPCHRIVKSDGSLSGYKWGTDRKKKLLDMERISP